MEQSLLVLACLRDSNSLNRWRTRYRNSNSTGFDNNTITRTEERIVLGVVGIKLHMRG